MSLSDRRTFLNISFIVQMLMFPKSHAMDNLRNMLQVNSRHTKLITFHHLKPRTDGYKFSTIVRFPKMFLELTAEIINSVHCNFGRLWIFSF